MAHIHGHVDIEALRQGGIVALDEEDMFSFWVKTVWASSGSESW